MKTLFAFFCLFFINAASCNNYDCTNTNIGVVVPLQHESLDLIINGLTDELGKRCPESKVIVKNAQGDLVLQSTLIKQLSKMKGIDYVVTVGTVASQTGTNISKKPILALAADKEALDLSKAHVVSEELPGNVIASFLKESIPGLKKITVIHSMNDKVFKELGDIESSLSKVHMQRLSVNNISDIYRVVSRIDPDSGAVLVLKDHSVVSAISLIKKAASKKNIPLVALDEGSVNAGADFAVGVQEYDIGVAGARLISTKEKDNLALNNYAVFLNNGSEYKDSLNRAVNFAKHHDYLVVGKQYKEID